MAAVAAAFVSASTAAAAAPVRRSNNDKLIRARRHPRTAGVVTSAATTSDNTTTIITITTTPAAAAAAATEEHSPSRREALATTLAALAFSTTTQAVVTRPASAEKLLPKVVVVGATGQTGALVVKALVKRGGSEVIAAVRSPDKAKKMGLDAGGVTLLPGFDVTGRGGFLHCREPSYHYKSPALLHEYRRTVFEDANKLLYVQAVRTTSTRTYQIILCTASCTPSEEQKEHTSKHPTHAHWRNGWKPPRGPLPTKDGVNRHLVLRTCCTIIR